MRKATAAFTDTLGERTNSSIICAFSVWGVVCNRKILEILTVAVCFFVSDFMLWFFKTSDTIDKNVCFISCRLFYYLAV